MTIANKQTHRIKNMLAKGDLIETIKQTTIAGNNTFIIGKNTLLAISSIGNSTLVFNIYNCVMQKRNDTIA